MRTLYSKMHSRTHSLALCEEDPHLSLRQQFTSLATKIPPSDVDRHRHRTVLLLHFILTFSGKLTIVTILADANCNRVLNLSLSLVVRIAFKIQLQNTNYKS